MMRGRIGIFLFSLQDMGGAVRVAISLANRMCEDYDVTLIELAEHDLPAFEIDERVGIYSLCSKKLRIRDRVGEVRAKLGSLLTVIHFDVMFGIGVEETTVAILPCRSANVPLVFCDHGALVNQLDDKTTTLLRFVCSRACFKTVVLTKQTFDDYRRLFRLSAKKLHVIPNWISNEFLENAPLCDVTVKRILWAGRLDREKGTDHLLEIAKIVMPKHPDWTWDVYGSAVLGGGLDLEKDLAEAGLAEVVSLKGKYSDAVEVFSAYSIGTLTSYREGLPLFLLEGMALGLPLISFDVDTGPRDLIDEGENGYLVPCYDVRVYAEKLERLMGSVELRLAMSDASRAKASGFSEDDVFLRWEALIGECFGVRV